MRYFTLILTALFILGVLNLQAQQAPKSFEENMFDSVRVTSDLSQPAVAQMPIYNPEGIDSKILIHKPRGIFYNMPVIGQKDTLSDKRFILNLRKNLFKQGPADIDEEQKDDATE
jgi:hypothetical protein